jgi:large subunit ribosomal protein L13
MTTRRQWHLTDAKDQTLGRLSTQIAQLLMGKQKTGFARHQDLGDYVVVINSSQVKTTGKKRQQKTYDRYSGYPSGRKTTTLEQALSKNPTFPIRHAVSGMLPKNKLKSSMLKRLKIFPNDQHPYQDKLNHKNLEPNT